MSLALQHVFIFLTCWCLWERSLGKRLNFSLLPKEYLGRLDACRCAPLEQQCAEEVVAISFLTPYTHSVKVCAPGTRLCCPEAAVPARGVQKPWEDHFLLLKLPTAEQRDLRSKLANVLPGLSRHLPNFTVPKQDEVRAGDGDVGGATQQGVEGGSTVPEDEEGALWETTDNMNTTGSTDDAQSTSTSLPEEVSTSESTAKSSQTSTEWPEEVKSSTEIVKDSQEPDVNHTDAHPFTLTSESGENGNTRSTSDILSQAQTDAIECFTDTCHENLTLSTLSTVDVDAAMNVSMKESEATKETTESLFSTANKTTELPAIQDQEVTSSPMQDPATSPYRSHLLPRPRSNEATVDIDNPNTTSAPTTTPYPETTTTASTTTASKTPTKRRGFWAWLFG